MIFCAPISSLELGEEVGVFFLFLCNMKSRIILFLLTFLLLITLSACRHRYPKVLVETDCLICSIAVR